MVVWGVVEFGLHTIKPNTIQREDRIVWMFKSASAEMWSIHQALQIETANAISEVVREVEKGGLPHGNSIRSLTLNNSNRSWLLLRNDSAVWWSPKLSTSLVEAFSNMRSVLHNDLNGVYVLASSSTTIGSDEWKLFSASKLFEIANPGSRYGDVYLPTSNRIKNLDPAPFYLEGNLSAVPFDHRFSIIRLNEDATTGHLAVSTLDPAVRNYIHPDVLIYLRLVLLALTTYLLWNIIVIGTGLYGNTLRLPMSILLVILFAWSFVQLGLAGFFIDMMYAGTDGVSSSGYRLLISGWYALMASLILIMCSRQLLNNRYYEHSTLINKTTLTVFLGGSLLGLLYFLAGSMALQLHSHGHFESSLISTGVRADSVLLQFMFSSFVASIVLLSYQTAAFIIRSVRYKINWVLGVLMVGYMYIYMLLMFVSYEYASSDMIGHLWFGSGLLIIVMMVLTSPDLETMLNEMSVLKFGKLTLAFIFFITFAMFFTSGMTKFASISLVMNDYIQHLLVWTLSGCLAWIVFSILNQTPIKVVDLGSKWFAFGSDRTFLLMTIIVIAGLFTGSLYSGHSTKQALVLKNSQKMNEISGLDPHYNPGRFDLLELDVSTPTNDLILPPILDNWIVENLRSQPSGLVHTWSKAHRSGSPILSTYRSGTTPDGEMVIHARTNYSFDRISTRMSSRFNASILIIIIIIYSGLFISDIFRRTS